MLCGMVDTPVCSDSRGMLECADHPGASTGEKLAPGRVPVLSMSDLLAVS
jgi:hypothetical protein